MKNIFLATAFSISCFFLHAQEKNAESEKRGFEKDKLFAGGSLDLSFFNNSFLIGANPFVGYNLSSWVDAGVLLNFNYNSSRDIQVFDDKLKQTVYGAGAFTKIYPVKFVYLQAQYEQNFINIKYVEPNGNVGYKDNVNVGSFLVGGGYCSGREPGGSQPFYFLSVLFDVAKNENSPYTDGNNRVQPIIRAGFQIPLFQKSNGSNRFDGNDNGGGRRRPRNY